MKDSTCAQPLDGISSRFESTILSQVGTFSGLNQYLAEDEVSC